jgi:hydroxylamine reductase
MGMFCYQCEQTARGTGCTAHGICGKDPETAALQDVLTHLTKGIAQYAQKAADLDATDREVEVFIVEALFTTVTNVNFDPTRLETVIRKGEVVRANARRLYEDACAAAGKAPETLEGPAICELADDIDGLVAQALQIGITARQGRQGETVVGLQELLLYGLKGAAAYADHAHVLGREDDGIYAFMREALAYLAAEPDNVDELTGMCLKCGEANLKAMELLDSAHTGTFGHPEPTLVRVTPVAGKAILVTGHDLEDLKQLLEQTEGTGINVYTHGEMLPAHGYPELKKHGHLVGNYGGAWQDQRKEFLSFPGALLFTTNCIQKPMDDYADRLFTTGLVAWTGIQHIEPDSDGKKDFTPVIEAALATDGFAADEPEQKILVGFGHNAVLGVADKVVEAVKAGQIRRFFLIGGCDGAKPGRNYYTDLADAVPDDCVILTLACGKYRFNKHEFGDIGGIPRLLDIGQCNDAYSAIRIAAALAEVFGTDVNGLPLSIVLSWYEQKAVAILLTLLSLGIKNMRIGPSLPAFVAPPVLDVLVNQFGLTPIGEVHSDLEAMLAG